MAFGFFEVFCVFVFELLVVYLNKTDDMTGSKISGAPGLFDIFVVSMSPLL